MRAFIVLLAAAMIAAAVPSDAAEIDDHPLISRYPGSEPTRREGSEFETYPLIVGVKPDSLEFDSIELEGTFTRINYENPTDRSALEILTNYEQAIAGAGGEILYKCVEAECGPSFAGSRAATSLARLKQRRSACETRRSVESAACRPKTRR